MLLGVEPLEMIYGNKEIATEPNLCIHEYEMGTSDIELRSSLEPNHTHHILVEGVKNWGDEILTRNLIEEAICRDEHYGHSPMVLLVVGGGFGTLKTVRSALEVEAGAAARVGGRSGRSGWPHHRPA